MSTHSALSNQTSFFPLSPSNGMDRGPYGMHQGSYMVIGPSQDDLTSQGTPFSQGRSPRPSPGTIMGGRSYSFKAPCQPIMGERPSRSSSLPQGPTQTRACQSVVMGGRLI
ncbi:hypothetical protein DUNSADRAFT_3775 [Dunaliella salina]|uniref:Encoded protein n=1 Tax=Dunaliella salina TaxID=3046 RepID=A0ABQ7FV78_DUNSA|nr:hypothetical protein DUNSADRAFT_3775 [Dunaliella salina]|eukprot:KAF5826288.1 hypothetical protein DUNSADRAFT_3775 [Dunaliella salina]